MSVTMPKKTNKTERTELRLPYNLKKKLTAAAKKSSKTLNDYCIMVLNNDKTQELLLLELHSQKKILALYSSMSNNINQLAKLCNATGNAATKHDLYMCLKYAEEEAKKIYAETIATDADT